MEHSRVPRSLFVAMGLPQLCAAVQRVHAATILKRRWRTFARQVAHVIRSRAIVLLPATDNFNAGRLLVPRIPFAATQRQRHCAAVKAARAVTIQRKQSPTFVPQEAAAISKQAIVSLRAKGNFNVGRLHVQRDLCAVTRHQRHCVAAQAAHAVMTLSKRSPISVHQGPSVMELQAIAMHDFVACMGGRIAVHQYV